MIIFLGLVGLLIISTIFVIVGYHNEWDSTPLFIIMVVILLVAILISGIDILGEHTFTAMYVEKLNVERAALVYQMENNLYLGDALGAFNAKITYGRAAHENPWLSWYYGPYYMEVEPIPLS